MFAAAFMLWKLCKYKKTWVKKGEDGLRNYSDKKTEQAYTATSQ